MNLSTVLLKLKSKSNGDSLSKAKIDSQTIVMILFSMLACVLKLQVALRS